jgi:hypothetical protein
MSRPADPNRAMLRIRNLEIGDCAAFTKRVPMGQIFDKTEISNTLQDLRNAHAKSIRRAPVIDEKYRQETGWFITDDFKAVICVLNVWRVE